MLSPPSYTSTSGSEKSSYTKRAHHNGIIDKDSHLGEAYDAKKSESKFYRYAHFYSVTQVIEWLTKVGYNTIRTCHTIFKNPEEITSLEPVKEGYGEGGLVVISAQKGVGT